MKKKIAALVITMALAASATGPAWSQSSSSRSTSAPPSTDATNWTTIMDEIAGLMNQVNQTLVQQQIATLNAAEVQARATMQQANQELQAGSAAIAGAMTGLVVSTGISAGGGSASTEMDHAMSWAAWRRYGPGRGRAMQAEFERLRDGALSGDVRDLVVRSLA